MASTTQRSCFGFFLDLVFAVFLFAFGVGSPFWHCYPEPSEESHATVYRGLFKTCVDSDKTERKCEDIDVDSMPGRTRRSPLLILTLIEDRLPKVLFLF